MNAPPPPVEHLLTASATPSDSRRIDAVRQRLFGSEKHRAPEHYELHDEIGRGRFGRVFRATDTRFPRTVAVKVISYTSESELQRLEREAHALAQLSHPNIVQVFEKGIADVGTYFLAMEHVEGRRLDRWLDDEPRTLNEILEVFAQAAGGLHHAHERGLIHRDFKPSNVIVDTGGRVRILDFGLVKFAENDAGRAHAVTAESFDTRSAPWPGRSTLSTLNSRQDDNWGDTHGRSSESLTHASDPVESRVERRGISDGLTRAGSFMGTPHYAAPEQFSGGATDARTDQFSLCVALFEAAYGFRPFSGRTLSEISAQTKSGAISAGRASRHIPSWLRRLLRRGLSPEPEDRFDNVGEIEVVLRKHLNWSLGSRVKYWVAGAATAAAVIFAGIIWARPSMPTLDAEGFWPASPTSAKIEQLHGSSVLRALEGYEADWCAAVVELRQRPGDAVTDVNVQCLEEGKQRFRGFVKELGTSFSADFNGRMSLSKERMLLMQLFNPHDCLAATPLWESDQIVADRLLDAEAARLRGDYLGARDTLEQVREQVPRDLTWRSGLIDYQLGTVLLYLGDQVAWSVLAQAQLAHGENEEFLADVMTRRIEAGLFLSAATTEELEALRGLLEARQESSESGTLLMARAHSLFAQGKYEEARAMYGKARGAFEAQNIGGRYAFAVDYCRLHEAFMESWKDDPKVDREELSEALSRIRSIVGPEHPLSLRYAIKVARVFENMGALEGARDMLEQARRDRLGDPPRNPQDLRGRFDIERTNAELLHFDIVLATRTGELDGDRRAQWSREATRIENTAFASGLPPSPYDEIQRVRELLIEAYARVGELDAAIRTLGEMKADARSKSDYEDVCYYLEQFEPHREKLSGPERNILTGLLPFCEIQQ